MFLLRMAFLTPAVADFALSALTLYRMIGVADDSLLPRAQLAAVALCWGLLLLLGMRDPLKRAWILLPTAIVIAGIAAAFLVGFAGGVIASANLALALLLCGAMIWLCLAALKRAGQ